MISEDALEVINSMSNSRITNYVWPGMSSVLLGGDGCGLVRLFENSREQTTDITPHTHRYNFTAIVLRGWVLNRLWRTHRDCGDEYASSTIKYNDEVGRHTKEDTFSVDEWGYTESRYSAGQTYHMDADEMHSIKFSRNAKVLMFEGPIISPFSLILEPFVDGELVPTFHTAKWMFRREQI
jgi:hypothetical protein